MTPQTAFNKVYKGAMKQMSVSFGSEGRCAYRGDDRARCFVGMCIPDRLYNSSIEGLAAYSLLNCGPNWDKNRHIDEAQKKRIPRGLITHLKLEGMSKQASADFWTELQEIHDEVSPNSWKIVLESFAEEHELTIPK